MHYHVHLQPDAADDLDRFRKYDVTKILNGIETYLRHAPAFESKSRIKRLMGKQKADYRLLIDEFRVFYCIEERTVKILRVLSKDETESFYEK
jgi:mRNA-degrading endonuclease RelE of RelBE toxin-antitoxin system